MSPRSRAVLLAAVLVMTAGAVLARSAPRFAWQNTTLLVDYAAARWLGPLAIGLGAGLAAWAVPWKALRLALGAVAVAASLSGAAGRAYHLEADSVALVQRGLFGTDRVTWREVRHVESGQSVVVVWGEGDRQVRIPTGGLSAQDRAILDRTITRRVREARPAS